MANNISTNLDELIEQERRRAAERIAKLKRDAADEQRRIDARVIDLLREEHGDLYDDLAKRSAGLLAAERSKRAKRAKKAAARSSDVVDKAAAQIVDPEHAEVASWNG
ncbi:hypothetical protein [Brevibacterium aurantiacum]|uniref:Uncharacterized protein n=1 Tax=Brevibacterium aurantiacum TaxID=273384 RepID=A0A2A3Z2U5_BREAU|nr:hypothetical protein [Brevibacterium aurantiacum]PCC45839.1 hypothetical protein CIK64_14025 [Brevibacterium aurantiacum]